MTTSRDPRLAALFVLLLASACSGGGSEGTTQTPSDPLEATAAPETATAVGADAAAVAALVEAEEWLARMGPDLKVVGGAMLAGDHAEAAPKVTASASLGMGIVSETLEGGFGDAVRELKEVEKLKLKFVDAYREGDVWHTPVLGLAKGSTSDGGVASLASHLHLTWKDGEVTAVHTEDLLRVTAPHKPFEEVRGVPALESARRNIHAEKIVAMFKEEGWDRPDYFDLPAFDRHPGIAVVDIDRDGWDDLYVMARWGRNRLLRNKGDGTFEDVAAAWGLDLEDHCSSAVFADFDNDGDDDVFIGRTLARSVYLENTGRHFSEGDTGSDLPMLASAVATADIDGDGLLDVYVGTYGVSLIQYELGQSPTVERELDLLAAAGGPLLADFIGPDRARELGDRVAAETTQFFIDLPGPPNALLRNRGDGRFEPVSDPGQTTWRNTYALSFGDYDGDGDPDLYLANDFGPNTLMKNVDGVFTDATDSSGTIDIGLGMGVSWGDFDADGVQDLYVSNMFSKAGTRITKKLAGIDDRMTKSAAGNTLLRGGADGFQLVSGDGPDEQHVRIAGWSWGGQFGDLDNDGRLDLFVPAGYYTAPAEIASEADC